MPRKTNRVIDIKFAYTARGILGKTPSNETPTRFVVKGYCDEWWSTNGKREQRKGNSAVLVPKNLTGMEGFIEDIPLGTKVVFKESGKRLDNKIFSRSYSIEVTKSKKSK